MSDYPTITVSMTHGWAAGGPYPWADIPLDTEPGEYLLVPKDKIRFDTRIVPVPEVGEPTEITLTVQVGDRVLIVEGSDDDE